MNDIRRDRKRTKNNARLVITDLHLPTTLHRFGCREPGSSLQGTASFYTRYVWSILLVRMCTVVRTPVLHISVTAERLVLNLVCTCHTRINYAFCTGHSWGTSARAQVHLYTHLSTSIRSHLFIAQKAYYWL